MYAGTILSLTCDYTWTSLADCDTTPQALVTWIVDDEAVNISRDQISANGNTLTFSPVATSDTGDYICTLTVTTPQTNFTVQGTIQNKVERIFVEGTKLYYCLLVCMCPGLSLQYKSFERASITRLHIYVFDSVCFYVSHTLQDLPDPKVTSK